MENLDYTKTIKNKDDNDIFITKDLGLAAFLKLRGKLILGISITNGFRNKIFNFHFPNEKECEILHLDYLNSEFTKYNNERNTLRELTMRKNK